MNRIFRSIQWIESGIRHNVLLSFPDTLFFHKTELKYMGALAKEIRGRQDVSVSDIISGECDISGKLCFYSLLAVGQTDTFIFLETHELSEDEIEAILQSYLEKLKGNKTKVAKV